MDRRILDGEPERLANLLSAAIGDESRPSPAPVAEANISARPAPFWPHIPGYALLGELSRGSQGVVYQAVQAASSRTVAVKVLRDGPLARREERARLEREAHILSALSHPNIVPVLDHGTTAEGWFYLVTAFISGRRLDQYLRDLCAEADGGCSLGDRHRVLQVFLKVARAVGAAHERGIVHRDLKPSNILIDDAGEPHIVDFGLARPAFIATGPDAPSCATETGQFVGSLPWASPEQAEGRPDAVGVRSDVYALGLLLYRAVTGRLPYDVCGTVPEVLRNILRTRPTPPSRLMASTAKGMHTATDDALDQIILKSLSKRSEDRQASANELADDLERCLKSSDSPRRSGRRLVLATLSVVLAAVVVIGGAFWRKGRTPLPVDVKRSQVALAVHEGHDTKTAASSMAVPPASSRQTAIPSAIDLDPEAECVSRFPFVGVGYSVARQRDGKFVVAGLPSPDAARPQDFVVARFYGDGTRDTDFGKGGTRDSAGNVLIDVSTDAHAHAVAIDYSGSEGTNPRYGSICIAGCRRARNDTSYVVVARLRPDGLLDLGPSGFGDENVPGVRCGYREIIGPTWARHDVSAYALAISPEGELILGCNGRRSDYDQLCVLRLHSDGVAAAWFGDGDNSERCVRVSSIALQPDGKILVAGSKTGNRYDLTAERQAIVLRYLPDGTPDQTFHGPGDGGTSTLRNAFARGLALQPDGKILTAGGYCERRTDDGYDFAVARFMPNGALDPSFNGGKGWIHQSFGASRSAALSVGVTASGHIVVGGVELGVGGDGSSGPQFITMRLRPDGTPEAPARPPAAEGLVAELAGLKGETMLPSEPPLLDGRIVAACPPVDGFRAYSSATGRAVPRLLMATGPEARRAKGPVTLMLRQDEPAGGTSDGTAPWIRRWQIDWGDGALETTEPDLAASPRVVSDHRYTAAGPKLIRARAELVENGRGSVWCAAGVPGGTIGFRAAPPVQVVAKDGVDTASWMEGEHEFVEALMSRLKALASGKAGPTAEGSASDVVCADVNADGHDDLVVACPGLCALKVYYGRGDGRFRAARLTALKGAHERLIACELGDERWGDLLTIRRDGALGLLEGSGMGFHRHSAEHWLWNEVPGALPPLAAAGDFNGDGVMDVAAVNRDANELWIYRRRKGTRWVSAGESRVMAVPANTRATAMAFLHKPTTSAGPRVGGEAVIVAAATRGEGSDLLVIHENSTTSKTGRDQTSVISLGSAVDPRDLWVQDLDGDSEPELIVTSAAKRGLFVLKGRGGHAFDPPKFYPLGFATAAATFADFNGDGLPDIAVSGAEDGGFRLLQAIRAGGEDGVLVPYGPELSLQRLAVGDFNEDGTPDVAALETDGKAVQVLLSDPGVEVTIGVDERG
jgi:uncharacterized delta-60 repeat protein